MKKTEFFMAEKHLAEVDASEVEKKAVKEIERAFDEGNKNVVFFSENTSFLTQCALKYAKGENVPFSKVIYGTFDRASYLYTHSMTANSIDCILKECLCRPFVLSDVEEGICRPENYLERFEKAADENALVIIDGFDVAAASPYMRHLFAQPCRVLVLSNKYSPGFSNEATLVHIEKAPCRYELDILDDRQKELLMTLCAIFAHLDEGVPVVSSKSGVFDKASVHFYLGSLADELPVLEEYGFLKTLGSGQIYIDKALQKNVVEQLKPCADNCKSFMEFAGKMCDFRLIQNLKDVSAQIYTSEDNYCAFVSSGEFLCAYTYFLKSDKRAVLRLYNVLVSYMLEKLSMQKGLRHTEHLLVKNIPFYISFLCEGLGIEENQDYIYDEELYAGEYLPDFYTDDVKSRLDIVRLCVSFLRNVTACMYQRFEPVFVLLLSCLKNILEYIRNLKDEPEMKMALLDDVIRLCSESFDYFCVVDEDGLYYHFRDNCRERRIFYSGERESDMAFADSIFMGSSLLTLSLYAVYAEYLCMWLLLSEHFPIKHMNNLLGQMFNDKVSERNDTLLRLNAHYFRIETGYENYCDIYSACEEGSILKFDSDGFPEKRLLDNKRFLFRGFDGATIRGSQAYSEGIMNEITNGRNPVNTAITILNPDYPLSDETYSFLLKCGFAEKLCDSKNVSNLALGVLLEMLVCNYGKLSQRKSHKELCRHLADCIMEKGISTEAFLERMYHAVSSFYVSEKIRFLREAEETENDNFCDMLYERYCLGDTLKVRFCDDCIAYALYEKINYGKITADKKLLSRAIETHCAENEKKDCRELLSFFHMLP